MFVAPHDMNIGWRVVRPDFTSSNDFRWPFPGNWAEASGPFTEGGDGCPRHVGDGLCIALNAEGAASGGIALSTVLVVGYYEADVLARSEENGKLRVKRAFVLDVWDGQAIARVGRRANLSYAGLSYADLSGANLSRANLSYADLSGADLSGADLSGVRHDEFTDWPAGFDWRAAMGAA